MLFRLLKPFIRHFKNWHVVLLMYYMRRYGLASEGSQEIIMRKGPRLLITITPKDIDDLHRILHIWDQRVYTPEGFEVGPNSVVIDIGAHIGIFTLYAATANRSVKVYSYEPHPKNYSGLERNVFASGCRNVALHHEAVSGRSGNCLLYVDASNTGGHSLIRKQIGSSCSGCLEVKCVSLEIVLNEVGYCDLLKMDCEGAEFDILLNADLEAFKKIGRIAMEYHNNEAHNVVEIELLLQKLGYKVWRKATQPDAGVLYAMRLEDAQQI